jgi:hypothetical protein
MKIKDDRAAARRQTIKKREIVSNQRHEIKEARLRKVSDCDTSHRPGDHLVHRPVRITCASRFPLPLSVALANFLFYALRRLLAQMSPHRLKPSLHIGAPIPDTKTIRGRRAQIGLIHAGRQQEHAALFHKPARKQLDTFPT